MLNETVYLNGVNTRFNFALGVVNKVLANGVCRVALYDQGKPVTVSVDPSRLTKSADAMDKFFKMEPVIGAPIIVGCHYVPATMIAALRSLRDTRKKMFLPALGANFVFTTGNANAIPDDNGNRRFMVVENVRLTSPVGYCCVIRDANGSPLRHVSPGWFTGYDGSPKAKRELLALLRSNGCLGEDTAGKTAVDKINDTLIYVMHRHTKKTFITLELE